MKFLWFLTIIISKNIQFVIIIEEELNFKTFNMNSLWFLLRRRYFLLSQPLVRWLTRRSIMSPSASSCQFENLRATKLLRLWQPMYVGQHQRWADTCVRSFSMSESVSEVFEHVACHKCERVQCNSLRIL